jgi:RNA polymerase sigma factor (sigma-70 family)
MQDDATLLRCYAETRSNTAFAEIVQRHLNLVYSAALRQVAGDTHLAEDITQSVFTDLARKAAAVAGCPVLAGWLHTSTHYAAAKAVRTEQRRRAREQEAQIMHELTNENTRDAEWSRMRPVLDDAIRQLNTTDRDAILLRFFEGHAFAAIGARCGLNENTARMRVERALDKLRAQLARRGISSTTGALATVLTSQAVVAAPTALGTSITSAALMSTASGGAVVSFFQLMAITKTQVAITGALLIAGGGAVVSQQQTSAALNAEIASLHEQSHEIAALRDENAQLARIAADTERLRSSVAQLPQLRTETSALREKLASIPPDKKTFSGNPRASRGSVSNREASSNYDITQLDRGPVPKHRVAPVYPMEMLRAGITGEAVVDFIVDANGNVANASVVKSTHRELEAPALEAIKQWKFDPGAKNGRPVHTRQQVPIVFTLSPDETDWF